MPINQSLPAIARRRVAAMRKDAYDADDPQFLSALLRAADELEIRQRCATNDEQVAVEAIANNRRLRHNFEEVVHLVNDLPLPLKTKVAFQLRVDQILGSQRAAGDGRGILAVALPPGAGRDVVEARVRELLDNHWAATEAAAAAGTAAESQDGLLVDTEVVDAMPADPPEKTLTADEVRAENDLPALSTDPAGLKVPTAAAPTFDVIEVTNADLYQIATAHARGFNPTPQRFAEVARDLLRARGATRLPCSLCGGNILDPIPHVCDPAWRERPAATCTQVWLPAVLKPAEFAAAFVARFPGSTAKHIPVDDPKAHPVGVADGAHYFEVILPTWAVTEIPAFLRHFAESHGCDVKQGTHSGSGVDA